MEGQTATAADTTNEGSLFKPERKAKGMTNAVILRKLESLTASDGRLLADDVANFKHKLENYRNFINRVDRWYTKNEKRYLRYMGMYGREILTEAEFKLGLLGMQTPFSELERHMLYQLMDPGTVGKVDYSKFYEALWKALALRIMAEDERGKMDLSPPDRWILMHFKVPSAENFDLPTNFEREVNVDMTGSELRQIIRAQVPALYTRHIIIFTDPSKYTETLVHCHQPIGELNFKGGPKYAPTEATIYYEFSMGRLDCPIILFSHIPDKHRPKQMEQPEDEEYLIY